jgi:lysozyme
MKNRPVSKPKAAREVVVAAAKKRWEMSHPGVPLPSRFVLGVRSYFQDTMGEPGANDYGINDDAFFIVTPDGMTAWNGNTDPSRIGWNPGAGKYMARLKPGCWKFRRLKHKMNSPNGYMAFGQGPNPVTVERIRQDGSIAETETGEFGINLHMGGDPGTSSAGCLTVYRPQWKEFDIALARIVGKDDFDVILTEGPIN